MFPLDSSIPADHICALNLMWIWIFFPSDVCDNGKWNINANKDKNNESTALSEVFNNIIEAQEQFSLRFSFDNHHDNYNENKNNGSNIGPFGKIEML